MVMTGKDIMEKGIVTDFINGDGQTQQCGIDLTVRKIEQFIGNGIVDFDNSTRKLPELLEVLPKDSAIWKGENVQPGYLLAPGCYLVSFNETTSIPKTHCGIARPRSTMLRCGATVETAVFDPGYIGKPQCLLVVYNPSGLVLGLNAKVVQIVFLKLEEAVTKGYSGKYQYENMN